MPYIHVHAFGVISASVCKNIPGILIYMYCKSPPNCAGQTPQQNLHKYLLCCVFDRSTCLGMLGCKIANQHMYTNVHVHAQECILYSVYMYMYRIHELVFIRRYVYIGSRHLWCIEHSLCGGQRSSLIGFLVFGSACWHEVAVLYFSLCTNTG